jgi:copper oxidase (laccase) domain-containing protein
VTPVTLREIPLAGEVPRFEVPGWRERYGLIAGITGRGAGTGHGFDLGLWGSQPVGDVMRRWRALRQAETCLRATALGTQVHGDRVQWHEPGAIGWIQVDDVDGHATDRSGLMLTVTVADCIPVYLAAPSHGGLAILHAGWRGTAAGILTRGVETLASRLRCEPYELVMHCGVGICGGCYQVGREVMEGLGQPAEGDGPWNVDLRAVLAGQARRLGITETDWCSSHDAGHFYSHRRSQGGDGRMAAYLGAKP